MSIFVRSYCRNTLRYNLGTIIDHITKAERMKENMGHSKAKIRIVGNNTSVSLLALSLIKHDLHHNAVIECEHAVLESLCHNPQQSLTDNRFLALTPATVNLYRNLGIWHAIQKFACPTIAMDIYTHSSVSTKNTKSLCFKAPSDNEPLAYIAPFTGIKKAIHNRLHAYKDFLHTYTPCLNDAYNTPTAKEPNITIVTDTKQYTIFSEHIDNTRCKIGEGEVAITTQLSMTQSHANKAYQNFLPSGAIALLPVLDVNGTAPSMSLIWSFKDEGHKNAILRLTKDEFLAEIAKSFNWPRNFFNNHDTIKTFNLGRHIRPYLHSKHTVLLGEAAHTLHPLAGQNFNLTVKDIAELTVHLKQAAQLGLLQAPAIFLENYTRQRNIDTSAFFLLTETLNKVFSQQNQLLNECAKLIFNCVDYTPSLKDFFIQRAMGKSHNRLLYNLPI